MIDKPLGLPLLFFAERLELEYRDAEQNMEIPRFQCKKSKK
jgi:hypothetical protein